MLLNADELSVGELARRLDRTTDVVERFLAKHLNKKGPAKAVPKEDAERLTIRQELKGSESWKVLKKEFNDEELRYFEEGYCKLMAQFKSDVLPSEEVQIFQSVKFEILMSRNLQARSKALADINFLEKMQSEFLTQFNNNPSKMSDDDRAVALSMEQQLQAARSAEQTYTKEYVNLHTRHEALMKSLKSTRDQRVKDIANSKQSFTDLLKVLMERDVQKREGRRMELMRLAAEKAKQDLGHEIRYEDGEWDRPILTAETIMYEDEDG